MLEEYYQKAKHTIAMSPLTFEFWENCFEFALHPLNIELYKQNAIVNLNNRLSAIRKIAKVRTKYLK